MGAPDTGAMSDSKYSNPVALLDEHRDGRPIWKSALAWVVTTQFLRTDTSSYQLGSSMRHLNEAPVRNPLRPPWTLTASIEKSFEHVDFEPLHEDL